MDFGSEIRRRRQALDMTLEQLAESSHLTPNYIGTIENGKRDPSLSTVLALAKGLRVSPGELFGGQEGMSSAAVEAGLLFDSSPIDIQEGVIQILRSVGRKRRLAKVGRAFNPSTASLPMPDAAPAPAPAPEPLREAV